MKFLTVLFALGVASGCAASLPGSAPIERVEGAYCQTSTFKVDADFSTANMSSCSIVDDNTIAITLSPEDTPINASPWYAVRVTPHERADVQIVLRYEEHPHRYRPKISYDRATYQLVPENKINVSDEGFEVTIDLALERDVFFLSAQELLTNEEHDAWMDTKLALPYIDGEVIGASIEKRPVRLLQTNDAAREARAVVIAGRQHPPEISGALAMKTFADEVLGGSDLAREFRSKFKVIVMPNLNPDGVEHGYWRHNLGGLDLNRDWGPFSQPETQAAKRVIDRLREDELVLFLDFHSTRENVFYTQPIGKDGTEYGFTREWLARAGALLPEYAFGRKGAHNVDLPTSKNYIHERFGIPAITYELGDETERKLIETSAAIFAQEMMKLLLEEETS